MISAISAKPVASELARSAIAALPPARRSPMMPEPTTAARSSAVPTASAAADLIHLFLQRQALELLYEQREEKVDASAELNERLLERTTLVLVAALNRRRYAPMRADRAPRPDRAHLRSRRIANGEDEIDLGSGGPNEL